ncbi:ribosome biogenesis GTPase Der [Candidatus Vampirococcus lugosii]|nr:ribosome biogenesis GTPase Der [Candidatus Vampirococcus lugosii]
MKIGLVGQTNVGKSTIFNRFIGTYRAIITDIAGTTRQIISDNFYPRDDFLCKIYDSPGLADFDEELQYIQEIIEDSDLIIFVIDGKRGITMKDEKIKELIIKRGKLNKSILVVNKLDSKVNSPDLINYIGDFYSFGFENIFPCSSKSGEGLGNISDYIEEYIDKNNISQFEEKEEKTIDISFVGRPNTGKSTLINKFAQEDISIVKDTEGTTLDYIQTDINFKNEKYTLYDTAGIRKKGKILGLEKIAFSKTKQLLQYKKPVTIILIDIDSGLTHTDKTIIGQIDKLNVPIIVALNKSDLLDQKTLKLRTKQIIALLSFGKHIPIIDISAKNGHNLDKILKFAKDISNEYKKEITTAQLNKAINKAWMTNPPRFSKNKICKIYYATQIKSGPPKFLFFINNEQKANFAFKKWIINTLRKNFGFIGCPIILEFREREQK